MLYIAWACFRNKTSTGEINEMVKTDISEQTLEAFAEHERLFFTMKSDPSSPL